MRAPSPGPAARAGLCAALTLGAFALVVGLKLAFLGPFHAAGAPARVGAVALFVLAAALAWRATRAGGAGAAALAVPLAALLLVNMALTPMTFEAERFARRDLPRAPGLEVAHVEAIRPFQANHPRVDVVLADAQGRDAGALVRAQREAFERAGWEVRSSTVPGETVAGREVDYGFVAAARWGFLATCATGPEGGSLRCGLSVP